jgi:hypothetical protein
VDRAAGVICLYRPFSYWGGFAIRVRVGLRQVDRQRMQVTVHGSNRMILEWRENRYWVRMALKTIRAELEYRSRLPGSRPPIGPSAAD